MISRIEWSWLTEINGLIGWFIHWFVDWLNIQMGSHNLSVQYSVFVYSQPAVPCPSDWRGGGGLRAGSGERPCFEAAGGQSEGRWRERGGRVGEAGRLGASVRREQSWEMQWRSNYCHHWSVWTTRKVLLTGFTRRVSTEKMFPVWDLSRPTQQWSQMLVWLQKANTVNKTHQPTNSLHLSGCLFRMNEILDGLISGADCAFQVKASMSCEATYSCRGACQNIHQQILWCSALLHIWQWGILCYCLKTSSIS